MYYAINIDPQTKTTIVYKKKSRKKDRQLGVELRTYFGVDCGLVLCYVQPKYNNNKLRNLGIPQRIIESRSQKEQVFFQ